MERRLTLDPAKDSQTVHTAASLMFDAGLTLFEVQQRLGHKSPAMTAEVYTHLMRERFEDGRRRMDEYMAAKRAPAGEADVAAIRDAAGDGAP